MTVTQTAREAAMGLIGGDDEPPPLAGPVSVGMEVRIAGLGATGRLLALAAGRGEADVEVKGKRVRVSLAALSPASSGPPAGRAIPVRPMAAVSNRPPPSSSGTTLATAEVVLVGQRVDDALPVVEKAINDALLSGKAALRLVHGHGTGRLAAAVREFLKTHPGIASYRWGDAQEGGQAVTIARLDV